MLSEVAWFSRMTILAGSEIILKTCLAILTARVSEKRTEGWIESL